MNFNNISKERRLNALIKTFCEKKKTFQTPEGANFVILAKHNLNSTSQWRIMSYYSAEYMLQFVSYWYLITTFKYIVIIVKNYRLQ